MQGTVFVRGRSVPVWHADAVAHQPVVEDEGEVFPAPDEATEATEVVEDETVAEVVEETPKPRSKRAKAQKLAEPEE